YDLLILYDGKNFFPLQFEPENGYYTLMSGATAEKNYLTFDPEFMKKTKDIPENIYFDFLDTSFDGCVEGLCPQFFVDITGINNVNEFIKRFSKKHQKNFKHAYKKFGKYSFVKKGNYKELEAFNIATFEDKSGFVTEESTCYNILDNDSRTEYWSIIKDEETAFILQYFFYGKTMSVCVWGANEKYKDSLKVAFTESILLAKSRGCTRIDYAPTYSGWKFLYHLDTAPLWRYKRGTIPDAVDSADYEIPPAERTKLKAKGRI
ncbi:MAG: hypothetical protein AABY01_04315, partial [Nanoarchaeota archaeon]